MSQQAPELVPSEGALKATVTKPIGAKKKPYPMWLGGVAASIAGACTHPLDLTKVRMQTAGDPNMISSMRKTVGAQGIRGLYDGLTGTLLRQMTYSMMRFALYDKIKLAFHPGGGEIPLWKLAAAGGIAGGLSGGLCNFGEIAMVRMQADKAKPMEKRYNYRNSIQALSRMAREEGIGSWYRGAGPNTARAGLLNVGQLAGYDFFKNELLNFKLLEDGPLCHFVASFGAATVATTISIPADVVKSRIMSAHGGEGVMQLIRSSLAKEGPMVFMKGWTPAWIRLQPTTIITFMVLEQLKKGVDVYRNSGGTLI